MDLHHNYRCVKSVNNIDLSSFVSGEIAWDFRTELGEYVDMLNSFLTFRVRIEQRIAGGVTTLQPVTVANQPAFVAFLCKNPLGALFSGGRLSINDKNISNVSQFSSANTLILSVFDTPSVECSIDGSNTIVPLSLDDITSNVGVAENDNSTFTGLTKYASKSRGMYKYFNENALCDLIFGGNVDPASYNFRDIHIRSVLNRVMVIEISYATS